MIATFKIQFLVCIYLVFIIASACSAQTESFVRVDSYPQGAHVIIDKDSILSATTPFRVYLSNERHIFNAELAGFEFPLDQAYNIEHNGEILLSFSKLCKNVTGVIWETQTSQITESFKICEPEGTFNIENIKHGYTSSLKDVVFSIYTKDQIEETRFFRNNTGDLLISGFRKHCSWRFFNFPFEGTFDSSGSILLHDIPSGTVNLRIHCDGQFGTASKDISKYRLNTFDRSEFIWDTHTPLNSTNTSQRIYVSIIILILLLFLFILFRYILIPIVKGNILKWRARILFNTNEYRFLKRLNKSTDTGKAVFKCLKYGSDDYYVVKIISPFLLSKRKRQYLSDNWQEQFEQSHSIFNVTLEAMSPDERKYFPDNWKLTIDKNKLIIIYKFIEGSTMQYISKDLRKKGLKEIFTKFSNICVSIGVLHKYGIIHCDIHPDNILLDKNEAVRIIDFCSLSAIGNKSRKYNHICYRAPESKFDASIAHPKNDIFVLGLLLFYFIVNKDFCVRCKCISDNWCKYHDRCLSNIDNNKMINNNTIEAFLKSLLAYNDIRLSSIDDVVQIIPQIIKELP